MQNPFDEMADEIYLKGSQQIRPLRIAIVANSMRDFSNFISESVDVRDIKRKDIVYNGFCELKDGTYFEYASTGICAPSLRGKRFDQVISLVSLIQFGRLTEELHRTLLMSFVPDEFKVQTVGKSVISFETYKSKFIPVKCEVLIP